MKIVLSCIYKSPLCGLFMLRRILRDHTKTTSDVVKTKLDSIKTESNLIKTKTKKMHIYKTKKAFFVSIAIIVSIVGLLFFITPGISSSPTIFDTEINSNDLILLTNEIRDVKALNPLTTNDRLLMAATNKAKHLIQHDYFSHNSPAGKQFSEWVIESGYTFQIVGENLAIGFDTNKQVMKAWMESPSHRANILNDKYKEIGIIVLQGDINGNIQTIVVQIFGTQPTLRLSENFTKYIRSDNLCSNNTYS